MASPARRKKRNAVGELDEHVGACALVRDDTILYRVNLCTSIILSWDMMAKLRLDGSQMFPCWD